jgi:hypothetical protein
MVLFHCVNTLLWDRKSFIVSTENVGNTTFYGAFGLVFESPE